MPETIVMEGKDKFKTVKYEPTCFYGNYDCIYDSSYVRARYPETYKSNCSATCLLCNAESRYDNVDKGGAE